MKILISIFLVTALTNGCGFLGPNECRPDFTKKPENPGSLIITSGGRSYEFISAKLFQGVIFPKEIKGFGLNLQKRYEIRDYWTPPKEAVLKAEASMGAYLLSLEDKAIPKICRKLSRYKRQYVGIIMNNRRKIHINLFCCGGKDFDWKIRGVMPQKGSEKFFNLTFDPDSNSWQYFSVNHAI